MYSVYAREEGFGYFRCSEGLRSLQEARAIAQELHMYGWMKVRVGLPSGRTVRA